MRKVKRFTAVGARNRARSASMPAAGEGKCVALVRGFWVDVFVKRDAEAARRYITDRYIQHSPPPQAGGAGFIALWAGVFANPPRGPGKDFPEAQRDYRTRIVSVVGDDVLALLEARDTGTWDRGNLQGKRFDLHYYDLFRCEGDKLVEHWYFDYTPPR